MVEDCRLSRTSGAGVVMRSHSVEELRPDTGLERGSPFLDQAQAEVHVPEQPALLRGAEDRAAGQLDGPPDVVEQGRREQEVGTQPRMELSDLAADRRDADGVLEEPAGVPVVSLDRRGELAQPSPEIVVSDEAPDRSLQAGMRDLAGEELEEPLELVCVPAHRGRELGRIETLGGLEGANLELQPVAETLDAPEDTHGVALCEATVEQVDVAPDAALDPAARVDELDGEVRSARLCPQPLLSRHRVDAFDDPVLLELGDRRHESSLGPRTDATVRSELPEIKPFRALRYDTEVAGPLDQLIAPPYDVIGPEERARYLEQSPHNVVHLTLPDSEEAAGRTYREWREQGVLTAEPHGFWALSQDYVGPDGVARTRTGLVGSLRVEPYETGSVLPHERTHRGPKEGRLRLLRETRAQLEPIFLLYEGDAPFEIPGSEPDIEVEGARLWRLDDDSLGEAFADKRLLIADGHHRYETALAYHEEVGTPESGYMMVVLVSVSDPGLMIFPPIASRRTSTARTRPMTTSRSR